MCLHVGEESTSLVCPFYLGHDTLQLFISTLNCFDEIIDKLEVMGLHHPFRPGAWGHVSVGGAQRPSAVPAHSTGCPQFGADGRCQLEYGSLACSLHAAGLTGFSSTLAKGFWTRVAVQVGSWCHCLPPLLTIAASFVAQRLLYYNGFVTKSLLKHLSLMKASGIKRIITLPEKFTWCND